MMKMKQIRPKQILMVKLKILLSYQVFIFKKNVEFRFLFAV